MEQRWWFHDLQSSKSTIFYLIFSFSWVLEFWHQMASFWGEKAISYWMVLCRDIRVWSCDFWSTHACVHNIDIFKHCQIYHDVNCVTAVLYQYQDQYEKTYEKSDRKDIFVTCVSMTSMTKCSWQSSNVSININWFSSKQQLISHA